MCQPTCTTGLTSSLDTNREVIALFPYLDIISFILLPLLSLSLSSSAHACYGPSTGDEAVKAKNVFYYLTYTGAVNLESIQDTQLRKVCALVHAFSTNNIFTSINF